MINNPKLPSRFENFKNTHINYRDVIVRIEEFEKKVKMISYNMAVNNSGHFLVLKGQSGCGKTTLINTLNFFLEDIEIMHIEDKFDVGIELEKLKETKKSMRLLVLENRESTEYMNNKDFESNIHSINKFIRSKEGVKTIVVWPTNSEILVEVIEEISKKIGGEALCGEDSIVIFNGPDKDMFIDITRTTFEHINKGLRLIDFGIIDETELELCKEIDTLGDYINRINKMIARNLYEIHDVMPIDDSFSLTICVVSSNNPEDGIYKLLKGLKGNVDISSLLEIGDSNTAKRLANNPKVGLLVNKLNCKIVTLPPDVALDILFSSNDENLKELLSVSDLASHCKRKTPNIHNSMLVDSLNNSKLHSRKSILTDSDAELFSAITSKIAALNNDKTLNRVIAEALKKNKIIYHFEIEKNIGFAENRKVDIKVNIEGDYVYIEMMWRNIASEKDIAKYTLDKIEAYGRTIGYLS